MLTDDKKLSTFLYNMLYLKNKNLLRGDIIVQNDDVKKNLPMGERATKRVKFSKDTKENLAFTPLAKPHTSAVRKIWIQRTRAGEYEQLKKDLTSYENRGVKIEDFFRKEGRALLNWAISTMTNAEPLSFICENVPKELIKEMLSSKNYSMLNTLLLEETGMEELNRVTPARTENFGKKIKNLLNIDPNGVREFLENSLSRSEIGPKVKDSIKKALSDHSLKSNQYV